jgi:hypothetical protein
MTPEDKPPRPDRRFTALSCPAMVALLRTGDEVKVSNVTIWKIRTVRIYRGVSARSGTAQNCKGE